MIISYEKINLGLGKKRSACSFDTCSVSWFTLCSRALEAGGRAAAHTWACWPAGEAAYHTVCCIAWLHGGGCTLVLCGNWWIHRGCQSWCSTGYNWCSYSWLADDRLWNRGGCHCHSVSLWSGVVVVPCSAACLIHMLNPARSASCCDAGIRTKVFSSFLVWLICTTKRHSVYQFWYISEKR